MYKVFIYNKPIYFIEESELNENTIDSNHFKCKNAEDVKAIQTLLKSLPENTPLFVSHQNLDKLLKIFFKGFKKIEAAGGLVLNQKEQILFIDRIGFWDLPKGKVEKGEELKNAAIREVEEECGISQPKIIRKLIKTYHTYSAKGKDYFKTTHWYLMSYNGSEKLIPQIEEGIVDVQWVSNNQMEPQMSRTYPSVVEVLSSYLK